MCCNILERFFKKLCKSNINCDETWPWQPSKEMALPNVYVSPLRCFACGTNQFFFCLSHPDLRRDLFFPQLPKSWVSSLHGFSSRIFQNVSGQSDLRRLQSSHCFYFFHELSPFQYFFKLSLIQLPQMSFLLSYFLSFAPRHATSKHHQSS